MKSILCIALIFWSMITYAQDKSPAQWVLQSGKSNTPGRYVIQAKAIIGEGWHVFAPDPGGDGLLIPTSIQINNGKAEGKLIPKRRPVTHEMKEIGWVNYYEGEIEFTLECTINADEKEISGILTYQCCNDKMCLPPVDEPFRIPIQP